MNNVKLIKKYCVQDSLETYDPYDIWKTRLGFFIKNGFNKNKYLFIIPAVIFTIIDILINNKIRLFYKRQEYPVVRAFATLSLLSLYEKENKQEYLEFAEKHIDWLLSNYSKGYSGYCWGINFRLPISKELVYPYNTPYSTNTPYVLEALIEFYKQTNNDKYLYVIKSVFNFLENDLKVMFENETELAISYGPLKDRIVANSISYTMYSYALLLEFFPNKKEYITNKIKKLYNFIVMHQQNNGSWLYAPLDENSFIDCFHSAFVIKNIIKTNNIVKLENSDIIIEKGYNYLKTHFYNKEEKLFKRFSLSNKPSLTKFDLYDNAEMLNLAILMKDEVIIKELNKSIYVKFVKNNSVYSFIDFFNIKRNKNTLRWAVMPYIYSISKL